MGFVAPVILVGKQILQQMCQEQADWDSPLSNELRPAWERWREDLHQLEKLNLKRCFKPDSFGDVKRIQLHHFSDASTRGYGQCSYLRVIDNKKQVHCSLVIGKARVAPLKPVTIPRLELTAAVVSVKVSEFLQEELKLNVDSETFWTDSKVVLGYISNESRRFHVFVANRIQRIREHSDPIQWRYVGTKDNPVDDGSRGLTAKELVTKSKWTSGPDFIWSHGDISNVETDGDFAISPNDPEVKMAKALATRTEEHSTFQLERFESFSSWFRLKRAVAACLKLKGRLTSRVRNEQLITQEATIKRTHQQYHPVSVEDLHNAEMEMVRLVQDEAFNDEIQTLKQGKVVEGTSSLYRLDPFVDADGLLRIGGRVKRATLPNRVQASGNTTKEASHHRPCGAIFPRTHGTSGTWYYHK